MNESQKSRFGFAGGAALGVVLVVFVAVGWALGGRSDPAPTPAKLPAVVEDLPSPHTGVGPDVGADPDTERLRTELASNPERLDLRRRLAIELLRQGDFYGAFEEAKRVLAQDPDAVDGLFVIAAVRVRMGQPSQALPLLERVLEQAPDHVPALTAKGQALLKAGHAEAAVAVWSRALELSGGSNSQVEELLRSVPAGVTAPHPLAAGGVAGQGDG